MGIMTTKVEYMKAVYICDTCKLRWNIREDAEACEKLHKCKHPRVEYEADGYKITKKCSDCNHDIMVLSMYAEDLEQHELETIYKILEGTNV